jgi:hypothetical protein
MRPYNSPELDVAIVAAKQLKDIYNAYSNRIKDV